MSTEPTLEEVARLAGVSRATASRAINGGARVSAQAQEAVDEAVRRLGYSPNPAARSLVTRRTDSIAVVVPEPDEKVFSDPFFARTLHVVTRVLSERDLQVVLLLAAPGQDEERLLRYLRGHHIDGAIVVSHHRSDTLTSHLADMNLPVAFVGRPWVNAEKFSYVDTDNVAGAHDATELLISRGCRRIGTVAGRDDMSVGADRLRGWREALAAAGLVADAVAVGDFTEEGGALACEALLKDHPDLDGLMVASDLMASGALRVLLDSGRSVPADVAVTGYDDLGIAERSAPPLTTIRSPVSEMAAEAAALLLAQLDGRATTARRVLFTPTLVRRASA